MKSRYKIKLPQDVVTGFRESLIDRAARLSGEGVTSTEPDVVRKSAETCGAAVAASLDQYWGDSETAPEGPIDVIDMFSGCGGMSAGFRAVNAFIPAFRLALAVDIDEVANRSYMANFGAMYVNEDVHELATDKSKLERLLRSSGRRGGRPLILIGCAPCQGFSSHRNAVGESDQRNSLFVDFARIAANLKPDAVVVENVPELLTTKYWMYVEEARRLLEAEGYFVHLGVHNMAEFGVPQERYRALMLALKKPFRPPRGFLRRGEFRTVRQAIGRLPRIGAGERHHDDPMHYTVGHKESTIRTIRAVPVDGGSRPPDVGPQCLQRIHARQGKAAYEDVYGRLYWDRPAITITAHARNPASGRFVHPEQDRGLSVREAATLQGFPSGYLFEGTLDQRFRQIGNAVPPPFAAYLASHLLGEILSTVEHREAENGGVTKPVGISFSRLIPSLKAKNVRNQYSSDPN